MFICKCVNTHMFHYIFIFFVRSKVDLEAVESQLAGSDSHLSHLYCVSLQIGLPYSDHKIPLAFTLQYLKIMIDLTPSGYPDSSRISSLKFPCCSVNL